MNRLLPLIMLCLALLTASFFAEAQDTPPTPPAAASSSTAAGSTAFCLYELPADENGRRRWVNLGIVQYVEFGHNELRIYYGGGNLGSGHEARLPITNPAQLQETLDRLRQAAANCR